jgi:hypothetical protein
MSGHDAILRRTQRNEVLEVVVAAGLDPSTFYWDQRSYVDLTLGTAELLIHRETGCFYEFLLWNGETHYGRMSPAPDKLQGEAHPGDWKGQIEYVRRWAQNLRDDIEAPDLWTSVTSWETLVEAPPSFADNSPFTPPELAELNERLDVIGGRLVQLVDHDDLSAMAADFVDHLRSEAPKQGRRDWFFLALGALMSFMVNASFDPSRAHEIVSILADGVRSLTPG